MTGSLQKKTLSDGKEYFYIVLNLYDKHTGIRKQKWITTGLEVIGNKRKATKMLADELAKYDTNKYDSSSEMFFSDWVAHWLEGMKAEVELSTYEGYALHSRHVTEYFSAHKLKLKDLKARHFEEYYHYMLTSGKVDRVTGEKAGLAIRTVRSHKFIINAALNQAVLNEIIASNPALNIKVTNKSKKQLARKIQFFTQEEANEFIRFTYKRHDVLADLIYATLYFGLRRSEVLALTEDSVDFKRHKLHIDKTIVKVTTLQKKDRTKTPDSMRTYTLSSEMEEFFHGVIRIKQKNKLFYGDDYQFSPYLFTWEDGHALAPDYVYHHFKKLVKEFGRPEFTFHNLRHSTASILFERKWQPKDIQEWLGHADFYTTMNIYTHISKYHQDERAESLNGTLLLPNKMRLMDEDVRMNVRTESNTVLFERNINES